jgi:hypothetical protein
VYIKELVAVNNMRAAWVYLAYREQQMQAQRDATAAQMQQMNAQQAQQQEALKIQMQLQSAAALKDLELKNMTMEYYYKMQLEQVKLTGQIPGEIVQTVNEIKNPPMQQGEPAPEAAPEEQPTA